MYSQKFDSVIDQKDFWEKRLIKKLKKTSGKEKKNTPKKNTQTLQENSIQFNNIYFDFWLWKKVQQKK
jgi:hypothetical protein